MVMVKIKESAIEIAKFLMQFSKTPSRQDCTDESTIEKLQPRTQMGKATVGVSGRALRGLNLELRRMVEQ